MFWETDTSWSDFRSGVTELRTGGVPVVADVCAGFASWLHATRAEPSEARENTSEAEARDVNEEGARTARREEEDFFAGPRMRFAEPEQGLGAEEARTMRDSRAMNVCVTGGAGYIGSHMVRVLLRAGHGVVVIDDLSAGHRDALPADVAFVHADVRDAKVVEPSAARSPRRSGAPLRRVEVGRSVTDPRLYWRDNHAAAVALLETVLDAGVKRFILSSTAAVYGDPVRVPLDEEHPTSPVNPYGATKLAIERMLADYKARTGLTYAALRAPAPRR